jgi:iron(III) transport system substrate-binding protein
LPSTKAPRSWLQRKKLADWASSKDAMMLYGKNFAITAQPGVAAAAGQCAQGLRARLVKMDFQAWAAANRERILAEWNKRYNSKSRKAVTVVIAGPTRNPSRW